MKEQEFTKLIEKERKDIDWNINYHKEKLSFYKIKLKMLGNYK